MNRDILKRKIIKGSQDRHMSSRMAFTLIELLVIVAIIGVLAAVVIVNLDSAQARSRDTKRVSDLNEVAKTLQRYHADNGRFPRVAPSENLHKICGFPSPAEAPDSSVIIEAGDPDAVGCPTCVGKLDGWYVDGCLAGKTTVFDGLVTKGYMAQLPKDPKDGIQSFGYSYGHGGGTDATNSTVVGLRATMEQSVPSSNQSIPMYDGACNGADITPGSTSNSKGMAYCIKIAP